MSSVHLAFVNTTSLRDKQNKTKSTGEWDTGGDNEGGACDHTVWNETPGEWHEKEKHSDHKNYPEGLRVTQRRPQTLQGRTSETGKRSGLNYFNLPLALFILSRTVAVL